MLGRFVTGWLSLETKTSCPDFGLYARAGVLALERRLHPFSIFLCSVVRSSVGLAARAGVSERRSSVELEARAEAWFCISAGRVHPALERKFGCSSGSL